MLFVFGLTANAFAIHADIPSETQAAVAKGSTQITLDGEIRERGWLRQNVGNALPTDQKTDAFFDTRVRLGVEAKVTPNTTGYVQLETGKDAITDTDVWGSGVNNKLNGGSANLTILQAWILHTGSGLLGVPAGVKMGHMPLALGQRQFLDHTKYGDDALVLFADPIKGLHIGILDAKFAEGRQAANKDIDGYVALATYKVDKNNTIGINYSLVKATDTPVPGAITPAGLGTTAAVVGAALAADQGVNFQNLGIHANGNISGVTYEFEFDTQFGKILQGTVLEQKMSGNAVFANLGYKIDPVNVRLGFAMGSGDSNGLDGKVKEFQTTMGNDLHYSFIYEYLMKTAANLQMIDASHSGKYAVGATGMGSGTSTGIANTTYLRLGFDYAPTKSVTTSLDGFILKATKTAAGVSKNVGNEIDLKIAYKIDRNLTYGFTAGFFSTGNFYVDSGLVAAKKDVTAMMHSITLSF